MTQEVNLRENVGTKSLEMRKFSLLFCAGGAVYSLIEMLFRGWTHWSMAVVGGACLWLIFQFTERRPEAGILTSAVVGAAIITALELVSGCLLNLWLGWEVWDYSGIPMNLWGQICLPFSALWFLLCIPVSWICHWLRR